MNKTPRLSKSGIEYLDYMWGIWSGCYNWRDGICKGFNCWAKGLATRFKNIYPNGFEPTFYPEALESPKYLKKPSRIGVGWVGDVIGYTSPSVRIAICDAIKHCPQHTFLFLTKNPEKLSEWDFPDNAWVGVTATDYGMFVDACGYLGALKHEGKIKTAFVSIEPLLSWDSTDAGSFILSWLMMGEIDQVIIGAQTNPLKIPPFAWVVEIVNAADKAGIPVFLKNNLNCCEISDYPELLNKEDGNLRQEFPK